MLRNFSCVMFNLTGIIIFIGMSRGGWCNTHSPPNTFGYGFGDSQFNVLGIFYAHSAHAGVRLSFG